MSNYCCASRGASFAEKNEHDYASLNAMVHMSRKSLMINPPTRVSQRHHKRPDEACTQGEAATMDDLWKMDDDTCTLHEPHWLEIRSLSHACSFRYGLESDSKETTAQRKRRLKRMRHHIAVRVGLELHLEGGVEGACVCAVRCRNITDATHRYLPADDICDEPPTWKKRVASPPTWSNLQQLVLYSVVHIY